MSETYEKGVADERERIATWLEIHSIDWDCSCLVHDPDDYDKAYCEGDDDPYDEFKSRACQRRTLADIVRGKITVE